MVTGDPFSFYYIFLNENTIFVVFFFENYGVIILAAISCGVTANDARTIVGREK
tara:strand:+ start:1712 stop:1873 length:162 start_codon:yes stop_codon:yes gene_type:complete